jgi:hypothetical protein
MHGHAAGMAASVRVACSGPVRIVSATRVEKSSGRRACASSIAAGVRVRIASIRGWTGPPKPTMRRAVEVTTLDRMRRVATVLSEQCHCQTDLVG